MYTMSLLAKCLTPLRAMTALATLWALMVPQSGAAQTAPAPSQSVTIASDVPLRGHWFAVAGSEPRPAILALHGCGGLYAGKSATRLGERYQEAAQSLNAMGYDVLLLDSFGSRGVRQICQTRYSDRTINVTQRVGDAEAALAWLVRQPGVDVARIGVLGWSNGGSTTLNLLAQRSLKKDTAAAEPMPAIAAAAVFYPGCKPLSKRHADLGTVPLLIQIGALDDWTPSAPCETLVQQLRARPGTDVDLHVYPGSYHGFDGKAAVRLRTDVPNGTSAEGVHQGGNPEARVQALQVIDAFWRRTLALHKAAP